MEGRSSDLLAALERFGLGVAPGLAVLVALWPEAGSPSALGWAAFAGYVALVAVASFVGTVLSHLEARWAHRAARTLDRWLLWHMSRFEREYRSYIRSTHQFVDLKGLLTQGPFTPGLEKVFVDVSLTSRPPQDVPPSPVGADGSLSSGDPASLSAGSGASGDPAGSGAVTPVTPSSAAGTGSRARQSIDELLEKSREQEQAQEEKKGALLAVLGGPGTGKTTLLKHLALRRAAPGGRRGQRRLPVLLFLRDHAAAIASEPGTGLPEVVQDSLGSGLKRREPPGGWFERRLQSGRCLVLLDGLDEIPDESERRAVAAWIDAQRGAYPKNDFVITSRPHGYTTAPVTGAWTLQVRRFTGAQVSRFVHGWYRAVQKLSTDVQGQGQGITEAAAAKKARDLLRRLRTRPALYELAANPLLLTMIANVHHYRDELPSSRAALYKEIVEVLLYRRREAIDLPDVPGDKKEVALHELAYAMSAGRQRDIRAHRAAGLLKPVLDRLKAGVSPQEFLGLVVTTGLLVERESELYSFAHLTLQEHLTALHVQRRGLGELLTRTVDDDWWREPTLLYAARVDPTLIVQACLESGSIPALALAFDCAEAAIELDPALRERLEALRRDWLGEPPGSARRRLMTAVTATRQLRQVVSLSDDTLLSAQPVLRETYRLFLADTGRLAAAAFLDGPDDAPAVGVTHRDAVRFVDWVNDLLPDAMAFRLPTWPEVTDPAVISRSPDHTVWYTPQRRSQRREAAALPALWVPPGHPWSAPLPTAGEWPDLDSETVLELGVLGLSKTRAQDLVGALEAAVHEAEDLSSAQELVGRLKTALQLAHSLARDLRLAGAHDLTHDPEHARDLAHARGMAERLASDLDEARHTDLLWFFDQARARELARETLAPELRRSRALARDLADNQALARVARRLRNAPLINEVLQHLAARQGRSARLPGAGQLAPAKRAAQVLVGYLAQHAGTHTEFREDLGEVLRTTTVHARRALSRRLEGLQPGSGFDSIQRLADRTAGLAESVLGTGPGTGQDGHAQRADLVYLQLASLALAAASDLRLGEPRVAARYRTAAAGATVLRDRADGTVPPSETLVLARA